MRYLLQRPLLFLGVLIMSLGSIGMLDLSTGTPTYLKAMRARGLPATAAELNAWYASVPDEDNAALLYLSAAETAEDVPTLFWGDALDLGDLMLKAVLKEACIEVPSFVKGMKEPSRQMLVDYLSRNRASLDAIYAATERKGVRFPIDDLTDAASQRFLVHFEATRKVSRLLSLDMIGRMLEGDSDAVAKSLCAQFRAANALAPEPLLLPQLVSMAQMSIALEALRVALENEMLTAGQLSQVRVALEAAAPQMDHWKRAYVGEMITAERFSASSPNRFYDPRLGHAGQTYEWLAASGFRASGLSMRDTLGMAHSYQLLQEELAQPLPAQHEMGIERFLRTVNEVSTLTLIVHGAAAGILDAVKRQQAGTDLALVAITIEIYRKVHGTWPETLEALVPDAIAQIPLDPFSNLPLLYRTTPQGYILYSVGQDRRDNSGGDLATANSIVTKEDIAYRVYPCGA